MEVELLTSSRVAEGEVRCVDVTASWLVLGQGSSLALLRWQPALGWVEQARQRRAHLYALTTLTFSPHGALVASAGVDGVVRVWSREGIALRSSLAAPHARAVRALAWGQAARVVAAHEDGRVYVWRVGRGRVTGTLLACMRAHEDTVHGIALLADDTMLLTACADGVVKVFKFEDIMSVGDRGSDTEVTALLWEDGAHDLGVLCAAGSADGSQLAATGGHDGKIRLWMSKRATGSGVDSVGVACGAVLRGHSGAVTALRFGGALLASGSLDRTARLWCARAGVCLSVLPPHERYLTCVALAREALYLITSSNDKTMRTWSLGDFTLNSSLEPSCSPLLHFALGDLEGIAPVDELVTADVTVEPASGAASARRVWLDARAHSGPVNCIAVSQLYVATCSSDGVVNVYQQYKLPSEGPGAERADADEGETVRLQLLRSARAHAYPALAVHFDPSGRLLLSAGLDGHTLVVDAESGVEVKSVYASAAGGVGGGGVRDARFAPTRPLRVLLASDDGVAAVWSLESEDVDPCLNSVVCSVFADMEDGATCCAWSADGRALAAGSGAGELRARLAPHPTSRAPAPCQVSDAHDLGVLACDFAPTVRCSLEDDIQSHTYSLATGGRDALLKLWQLTVICNGEISSGTLVLCRSVRAHAGAVQSVRWSVESAGLTLASGGADRFARVWSVGTHIVEMECVMTVSVDGEDAGTGAGTGRASGAGAVALVSGRTLAVGALDGSLVLWRVGAPCSQDPQLDNEEGTDPRGWGPAGVVRWLEEYVTRAPDSKVTPSEESWLVEHAVSRDLRGTRLLDEPLDELLQTLGCSASADGADGGGEVTAATQRRLRNELRWLRRPHLDAQAERAAPHALTCPLTHRVLREPVRAADGYTYERAALLEQWLAEGGGQPASPMTRRRLHSARLAPNYRLRDRLRDYCGWSASD